jgi:putative oxidoreductase
MLTRKFNGSKNKETRRDQQMETLDRLEPYVFSILRIMVGLLFMQHGLVKLFGFPTGAGFPAFLSLTWFEGCIETIGGGLIVIGLFTRWAAFITSGEMAIGYFMVHAAKGFFPYVNGGNLAILYCFVFLYLVFAGSGPISIDALLWKKRGTRHRLNRLGPMHLRETWRR